MTRPVVHRILLGSAGLALLAAAALVLVLQRDSARRHQAQTFAVMEQLCRHVATLVVERVRERFRAVVVQTLEGISEDELSVGRLPRIAQHFDAGRAHSYVDRFFIWSRQVKPGRPGEVLFYRPAGEGEGGLVIRGPDGKLLGSLYAAPALGQAVWNEATRFQPAKRSFAVVEGRFGDRPYQLVIHYIWADPGRNHFDGLVGYTVDLTEVRERLFADMSKAGQLAVPDGERFGLNITIRDAHGDPVFGEVPSSDLPSASFPFHLVFYPATTLGPWLAGEPPTLPWTLTVSAPLPASAEGGGSYWLFAAVVFLILIGLGFAVTLDRQSSRLSRMQSEFIAHVSHQLKTPLALLSGAAETLARGRVTAPEKVREYAGIVRAHAARLSVLVDQAITFSIADSYGNERAFEVLDVSGLVREVVDQFKSGLPDDVHVEFETDETVPLVKGHASALEQVMWNLLENALKYGPGENSMVVSVSRKNAEAVIAVRDQGDGIAPDELPRVFDRFYRGRSAAQRQGFGLGLAYVQKVVRAHGGRISVNSAPGEGSEFRVFLPAA